MRKVHGVTSATRIQKGKQEIMIIGEIHCNKKYEQPKENEKNVSVSRLIKEYHEEGYRVLLELDANQSMKCKNYVKFAKECIGSYNIRKVLEALEAKRNVEFINARSKVFKEPRFKKIEDSTKLTMQSVIYHKEERISLEMLNPYEKSSIIRRAMSEIRYIVRKDEKLRELMRNELKSKMEEYKGIWEERRIASIKSGNEKVKQKLMNYARMILAMLVDVNTYLLIVKDKRNAVVLIGESHVYPIITLLRNEGYSVRRNNIEANFEMRRCKQ